MNKITFQSQVLKDEAIAKEKANHPNPTPEQSAHLADLENAIVVA